MKNMNLMLPILIMVLLLFGDALMAQEPDDKNFLFRSEKVQLSTFFVEIAPGTNFSSLNGQVSSTSVISAGFILNEKFSISFFSQPRRK